MINKNNKGVTLIALVITIFVLLIIVGITLDYGTSEIYDVSNKKMEAELGIVQGAVMQRYALVKSSNQLGIVAKEITSDTEIESDTDRPKGFVGTRLSSSSEITSKGFKDVTPMIEYSSSDKDKKYEEYYYLLDEDDLIDLGIKKGDNPNEDSDLKKHSYIVNYSTGEVFDVANKEYYETPYINGNLVYKQPTNITMNDKNYNFSDD